MSSSKGRNKRSAPSDAGPKSVQTADTSLQHKDKKSKPKHVPSNVVRTAVIAQYDTDPFSAENIERREAFLENPAQFLGQLQGGKTNEKLFKLPSCQSCRSHSFEWITALYSDQAAGLPYLPTGDQKQWNFGANISHFKFKLRVPGHVDRLTAKSAVRNYLFINMAARRYEDETLRQLRWISTLAFAWLVIKGQDPEEVQAAYDGKTYWITENGKTCATVLEGFKVPASGDEVTQDAFETAMLVLRKKKSRAKDKESVVLTPADKRFAKRLVRHKEHLQRSAFFCSSMALKAIGTDIDQHAETKLIDVFRSKPDSDLPGRLTVAGIRRPCFVCFARLQAAKEELARRGCTLVHKPRPGPYWPSDDALRKIPEDGMRCLMNNLQSGWHMYVNGDEEDNTDPDRAREGSNIDQDTDSENED